jgi:hypothetical protein
LRALEPEFMQWMLPPSTARGMRDQRKINVPEFHL